VLVTPVPGLRLLPGSSGDVDYPLSNAETLRSFIADLKSLEERSDYIFMDTSAGLTPEVVGFAVQADEAIVVTTPEPTAVMDAYAMIKVIHLTNPDVPIKVVMNAVRVPAEADDAEAKLVVAVNQFLNASFTYLGTIPYDHHVVSSIARQRAVIREFPTSSASLSLKAMAQQFLHQSEQEERRDQ
jgi:flagellar biosynthesis protein FlhG